MKKISHFDKKLYQKRRNDSISTSKMWEDSGSVQFKFIELKKTGEGDQ